MALGHVTRRDHDVLARRDDHRVKHPVRQPPSGPRLGFGDIDAQARLAGLRHPAVQGEALAGRPTGVPLAEALADQLAAVEPDQRAVRVVDVLPAKIDDPALVVADR